MKHIYFYKIILIIFSNFICSNESLKNRIIGGRASEEIQFPYMVSLRLYFNFTTDHYCGGTILNENWILTAAHCVTLDAEILQEFNVTLNDLELLVGNIESTNELPYNGTKIKRVFIHPQFDREFLIADVALIKVEEPICLNNDTIKPLKLVETHVPIGTDCVTPGWGLTVPSDEKSGPAKLQYLNVKIMEKSKCKKFVHKSMKWWQRIIYRFKIQAGQLCAGIPEQGYGICNGDSGSPLVCEGRLVGITSYFISECGMKNMADFYTDVYYFREWIFKCQENETYCSEDWVDGKSASSKLVISSNVLLASWLIFIIVR